MKSKEIVICLLIMGFANFVISSAQNIAKTDGRFSLEETKESKGPDNRTTVKIAYCYSEPDLIDGDNILMLNGVSDGEYVVIIVEGKILDFEHIKLGWDNEKSVLVEEKVINSIEEIKNQTVVISTYIPEGIPVEKIKWKSKAGEVYDILIQEDGVGENIKKFEMN